MFLLTGPPAAGTTSYCLAAMRECLRAKDDNCLLLVPTSTMAEHLRNQLAREGFVFSPRLIATLGRFVDELAPGLPPVGPGTLEIIVGQVLASMPTGRYSGVREFTGFRSALAKAIVEFSGAGGEISHPTDSDFSLMYEGVLAELKRRSLYLRSHRLAHAALKISEVKVPAQAWITGFSGFTPTEVSLIRALSHRARVTVTLPEGAASEALTACVTQQRTLPAPDSIAPRTLVVANTPDAEANEIARRILAEAAGGRRWREMGVVVRGGTMVPALKAAFQRFGVPARYYFGPPLSSDGTVLYLLAIVDAALAGWEHESSLQALRMHGSPLERKGDKWEYCVRQELPAKGLDTLRLHAPEATHSFFDELAKLSSWMEEQHTPKRWAERFLSLPALFLPTPVTDNAEPDLWREQASAIEAFRAAVEEVGRVLPTEAVGCRTFVLALKTVIQSASLRSIDRRRDVVYVIDAVEARQWRLPVVFVAGLLEGQFPRHHSENPILPDDVRRRLRAYGVDLKTAVDRQAEEQSLFDFALNCATEQTTLSYARLNGKGEANLPSFLLERAKPYVEETAARVRPKPLRARAPEPFAIIASGELRNALSSKHAVLSPSGIEMYASCPYSFFGARSLRLKTPPEDPYDRLNMLVQGNIAHLAFELHFRDNVPVREAFRLAFDEHCGKDRVPPGYRTEAVRLELLQGVELLAQDDRARLRGSLSLFEEPFRIQLGDGTIVNGRIDRLEIDERNNALIFDYKYRRAYRLKDTLTENESGERVQTGMYLLGAKELKYTPVGMAYCGFKKEVSVLGWVVAPHYPELNAACSEQHLQEVIATARETAIQAASDIRSGRIAPQPIDIDRCQWCEFETICRYEVREATQAAGGSDAA